MSHNRAPISARILAVLGGFMILVAPVFIYFFAGGSEASAQQTVVPKSIVGHWIQTGKNPQGYMDAEVSPGEIQIWLKSSDSSSVYWMGTFDTGKSPAFPFKTISLGDQDAMRNKILASQDATKTFEYKNGELSFVYSFGGSSAVIHLVKNEPQHTANPATIVQPGLSAPKGLTTPKNYTPRKPPAVVKVPSAPKPYSPPKITLTK